MQCFRQGVTNLETCSRIPFLNSLIHQIWEDLFLKVMKITCSVRPDLNLKNQEHQVGSLNNCIGELQRQVYAQRLELQEAHHGSIESRREQARLKEELSMKEKVLRDTQIRNVHELGEMKKGQEIRG